MKRPFWPKRVRQLLARIEVRKHLKVDITKLLLRIESVLTIPFFIASWLTCAIVFAVKAGFLMAKSEGAAKSTTLDKLLKPDP